jgi:hypothetical protein
MNTRRDVTAVPVPLLQALEVPAIPDGSLKINRNAVSLPQYCNGCIPREQTL